MLQETSDPDANVDRLFTLISVTYLIRSDPSGRTAFENHLQRSGLVLSDYLWL